MSPDMLNREAQSPYELKVCIGTAVVTAPASLKEVIEEADASLYEQKELVHR